jgi:hypothetical protein
MKRLAIVLSGALLLALFGAVLLRPRPVAAERGTHGRVSALVGRLLLKGADDTGWTYVTQNGAIADGDLLWTDRDSTAEIEMERGAWVRLAPDARVEIRRLAPDGALPLRQGTMELELARDAAATVMIPLAAGQVQVFRGSRVRVDLAQADETRAVVRGGEAAIEPRRGSNRRLAAGEIARWGPTDAAPSLVRFRPEDRDAFDEWCDQRSQLYTRTSQPTGVKHSPPGIRDLANYGEWIGYQGRRYWRPVQVDERWRPYHRGYWGNWRGQPIWMAQEPWGYTTSHYGRWQWAENLGWLWFPGDVWGPAWVRWANTTDLLAWAPLDPFGQPVFRRPPLRVGDLLLDPLVWSLMRRDNLLRRDPDLILALDRAPGIRLTSLRPLVDPGGIFAALAPDARVRGLRVAEWAPVAAPALVRMLENLPPRSTFRVAALAAPKTVYRASRDGRIARAITARPPERLAVAAQGRAKAVKMAKAGAITGAAASAAARGLRSARLAAGPARAAKMAGARHARAVRRAHARQGGRSAVRVARRWHQGRRAARWTSGGARIRYHAPGRWAGRRAGRGWVIHARPARVRIAHPAHEFRSLRTRGNHGGHAGRGGGHANPGHGGHGHGAGGHEHGGHGGGGHGGGHGRK